MALLVFDLDGTLVDSRRDLAESTNELLSAHGAPALPIDAVGAMVGDGARQLVARALSAARVDLNLDLALREFLEIYNRRLLIHTRPYDGIVDVVTEAAALAPLAVLTNKPDDPTVRLLDAFGIRGHFRWVIGGTGPFPRKPDPAGLIWLMREANAPPSRTLMIGDSEVDAATARAAGATFCLAEYGFGQLRGTIEKASGDFGARDANDLGRVIRKFLRS